MPNNVVFCFVFIDQCGFVESNTRRSKREREDPWNEDEHFPTKMQSMFYLLLIKERLCGKLLRNRATYEILSSVT